MNNENKRLRRKVRNSYIVSTVSISLVLFLLGTVSFIMATTVKAAISLQRDVTLIVELANGLSTDERETLKEMILDNPLVSEVSYSSKEEKLNDSEFRKMFTVEFEDILDENPLLDTFDVKVSASPDRRGELKLLVGELSSVEGVEYVSYPAAMIETMQSTIDKTAPLLALFALVLAVVSLALLNNTIRLAIFSKRYIINTMKLVGATRWFIIRPFMWSSVKQGVAAGLFAALLFGAAFWGAGQSLPELVSPERLTDAAVVTGAMVAVGVAVSVLFTFFAVNKFVNMKSNKIHLY